MSNKRISSDGNGGFNLNVQKSEWWKAGLLGAALIGALTMAGQKLVEDVHSLVTDRTLTEHRIKSLELEQAKIKVMVDEMRLTMTELNQTMKSLNSAIVHLEDLGNKKDGGK